MVTAQAGRGKPPSERHPGGHTGRVAALLSPQPSSRFSPVSRTVALACFPCTSCTVEYTIWWTRDESRHRCAHRKRPRASASYSPFHSPRCGFKSGFSGYNSRGGFSASQASRSRDIWAELRQPGRLIECQPRETQDTTPYIMHRNSHPNRTSSRI